MAITKLAILGLGSRSTLFYIKELNELYNKVKGGYSTCPFLLLNTDFNAINSLLPNTSSALDNVVFKYISDIKKLTVPYLLIPNITLHETVDRLNVAVQILHPIHLSIQKIKEKKLNRVVLFGSLFSMTASYIKHQFKTNSIEVISPNKEDMLFIDDVRKAIYNETETVELIQKYHSVLNKYSANNIVVISCTELSILNPKDNFNSLDMAQLQIKEAVKLITV